MSTRRWTSSYSVDRPPLMDLHEEFVALLRKAGIAEEEGSVKLNTLGEAKHICEIVISNPAKRGAMNATMLLQLGLAVDEVERRGEQVRGLILRGAGASFCAGLDLDLAREHINTPRLGILMSDFMTDSLNRLRDASAVSVCIINGPAIGGGSELVTSCDFRLMSTSARVQSVHARIGASPGWGGAARLHALVGRRHALTCLGSSAVIDAPRALSMGLADALIEPQPSDEGYSAAASAFLEPFCGASQSAASVRGIKYTLAAEDAVEMRAREGEVFFDRWFGEENRAAVERASKKT